MLIFTPCLFFQCVFTNFQCVIMLLRALSVALTAGPRKATEGVGTMAPLVEKMWGHFFYFKGHRVFIWGHNLIFAVLRRTIKQSDSYFYKLLNASWTKA